MVVHGLSPFEIEPQELESWVNINAQGLSLAAVHSEAEHRQLQPVVGRRFSSERSHMNT